MEILYGNVFLGENIMQAVSVYEAMKTESEYYNEALSKWCLDGNEMKSPSLSAPHFQKIVGHLQSKHIL